MAATVLVGLMAAGCTGDATPTGPTGTHSPSASADAPSATPTVSPTPDMSVAPARPDAMATPSADGAAAAASYFLTLYPYAYATGDTAEWAAMSAPECLFCSRTAEGVSRVHQVGNTVTGGAIDVIETRGTEIDAGRWYSAKVTATEAASTEVDPSGSPVTSSEGGTYTFDVALSFTSGRWIVDAVDVNPVEAG